MSGKVCMCSGIGMADAVSRSMERDRTKKLLNGCRELQALGMKGIDFEEATNLRDATRTINRCRSAIQVQQCSGVNIKPDESSIQRCESLRAQILGLKEQRNTTFGNRYDFYPYK